MKTRLIKTSVLASLMISCLAMAGQQSSGEMMSESGVWANEQSVAGGTVTAKKVIAPENGWLVVHRTDADHKPGPVVGYAPLKKGENIEVTALLTEEIKTEEKLMLMVHSEKGGMKTGVFEYTLGAKEDGPIKPDNKLVMQVITAQ